MCTCVHQKHTQSCKYACTLVHAKTQKRKDATVREQQTSLLFSGTAFAGPNIGWNLEIVAFFFTLLLLFLWPRFKDNFVRPHTRTHTSVRQIRVDRKSIFIGNMLKKVGGGAKTAWGRERKIQLLSPGPTIWDWDLCSLFCKNHYCLYSQRSMKGKVQSVHKQEMNTYPQKIPPVLPQSLFHIFTNHSCPSIK